jgi:predicted Zn-dependent protease
MRESFLRRDFEETLAAFQQLAEVGRMPRNTRIEATCLAARALIASKDRSGARALLKPLLAEDYTKPIHYDFLAHAFLDLRNYREAARLCERAGELQEAQREK